MIYCGYQGCGKTTYCKANPDKAIDLDSSLFKKVEGWEWWYINQANALATTGKSVFISAHREVIQCLQKRGIPFELLIPSHNAIAWRARLAFRFHSNPTQGNYNALADFDKHFEDDMAFYETLDCVKHYVTAKVVTDIGDFIK